jgi:hypothetical protein
MCLVLSWFEQDFLYRVEEGEREVVPSKIEAVRKDGEDFDEPYLDTLKARLEASLFPQSRFRLYFETDEFRRFARIYVDTVQNRPAKKGRETNFKIIVPAAEITRRITMRFAMVTELPPEAKPQLVELPALVAVVQS